ncbi:MAG: hypothetical protein EU529_06205 [Promethearchaeota archaeon]|nr:MAG: hypothetical protein EU529_06205 [Candidatus Lokiarchaeota archaeon]
MSLKFCPFCGGELDRDEDFCPSCGSDLRERKLTEKEAIPAPAIPSPPSEKVEKAEISGKQIADALPRIGALVIDCVAISGLIALAIIILLMSRLNLIILLIIVPCIMFFYFWIMEIITDGRTLGKMAFSLRTVNAKTLEPAKPGGYLVNNLLKSTPLTFIIDIIIGFFVNIGSSKKRLRIMQNLSNTCVIRT